MPDEYQVPAILVELREARRTLTLEETLRRFPPNVLYERCAGDSEGMVVKAFYNHAFIEAGFVLDSPEVRGGKPYAVCPVCGYVF